MGDVQRLPQRQYGGRLFDPGRAGGVTDAAGNLLQEWTWPASVFYGYIEKRATLYGPPPR